MGKDIRRVRKWMVSAIAVLLAGSVAMSAAALPASAEANGEQTEVAAAADSLDTLASIDDRLPYNEYIDSYTNDAHPSASIVIPASSYSRTEGMTVEKRDNYEGVDGISIVTAEEGTVEWTFNVPETGQYNLSVRYFPIEGKSSAIQRSVLIDGKLPFYEATYIKFDRTWVNELKEVRQDNQGNDIRPEQVESPIWQTTLAQDMDGKYDQPFAFHLTAGQHTLSFVSQREPMVIRELSFVPIEQPKTYADVKAEYEKQGYRAAEGQLIEIQGEAATYKSSPTLYPVSERASASVYPYSASKVKVNTIGGYNWRLPGQWISWEIDVPETGLYKIGMRTQQNFVRGTYAVRRLSIDGKVPFEEMEEIPFKYKNGYRMDVLGGDEPYEFYLTKGKHELRLEDRLGQFAPLIREVETSLLNLNAMYRKILMITSSSPDPFRDYKVEEKIPGLLELFQDESKRLSSISKQLKEMSGGRSDAEALLNTMADQLDYMIKRPDYIPKQLTSFKTNTGGLGTWIQRAREMPLEIDAIYVASPDKKLPKGGSSWWRKLLHELTTFMYSFFIDYSKIGSVAAAGTDRTITVWIGSGRDQAQTLKSMIDDSFTPKTGISVNVELVNMSTLLPATLAGQGPDVAMQVGSDIPVNYAMRNAVEDLSKYEGFDDVMKRFRDSAITPYRYEGGTFALPETQTFNMLFYRTDVLKELGLKVPETWDDVYSLLAVLNKKHMDFGLPLTLTPAYPGENIPPNSIYTLLLYQHGGQFYRNDSKQSDLDSRTAIEAFKQWTEFYTDYKLPKEFDFANRFRTGEMPIGIADYTMYNTLSVFAPEINGLWQFVPVPGTVQEDGTIDRTVPSGGSGVVMMQQAKDKEAAWEFMQWWTSSEAQTKFGREMEGLMGAAARYPTANIEALDELPWPITDYRNLSEQFNTVKGVPEVPGGYFTGRHLVNAFYKVVNGKTEARESLMDYVQYIQDEIRTKRTEFGLPN
ncbi:carbohydrate ABC transporter substrate-binding protein (CUT1 family) [Paenibacillus cellulosilyticus]|uniref:Carbohydrate ABC transporter substrate-binding protein (CUT1 family) n=1 Tax=Paenibacillus cellulosilyticus TaxID=375489 RepID=A0A2V2YYW2_9BACL|nr:extracellular solute-binding protein [Paenibacillus cellulosilyticus]PWW07453.1 carbohydrate ABC transporter substrate-binding protein (CUT1 family) [Paenibacillus cellulosilyticus]